MITRRHFLQYSAAAAVPSTKRPNFLLFMSDQETALLPCPLNTPNRRRIEEHGVRFTHAFCNTPQCSAARSALLTGLEPHQTGVVTNVDGGSLGRPLPTNLPNVGKALHDAGYSTGYFGKWHLGNEDGDLRSYGFDRYEGGVDDVAATTAAEWITAQKGPWLAWVSVLNPHNIYDLASVRRTSPREGVRPPASGLENLSGKPSEQQAYVDQDQGKLTHDFTPQDWLRYRSRYGELVEAADRSLGIVLAAVKDWHDTVIVYTSDHGDALGEHGLPFKGPFMYEPLIRIPLVISAPWKWTPGVREDMTVQADLAPMLADLAGVEWPRNPIARRGAVYLEYYAKQKWVNPIRTIRTSRWKLNWYDSGHQELYDLENDAEERHNVASDEATRRIRIELETRLNASRGPTKR